MRLVENPEQCYEYLQSLSKLSPHDNGIDKGFGTESMLMEYVGGTKYVTDVVMFRGKLLAAFVSESGPFHPPYFCNTSHIMPAGLSPEKQAQLRTAAYQSCRHCGLVHGIFNVDMKMTERGPKVIEINPRSGGFYLPAWTKAVYGVDIIMVAFFLCCDIQPHLWTPEPRGYCVGISTPEAVESSTTFTHLLRSLQEKNLIWLLMISEMEDRVTLHLSSFSPSKEEAVQRLLLISQALGLNTEQHPFRHFLEPLM
ncbi:carnosine synthase 1-like [Scleropages formosus]|uniref:carnosine synthase 1-like n=1 Tax=Scleropages formosus TaxID=113540 RepID=UPI000878C12E|nr:carnosine synthase 1-like [Scleropages formosus]